MKMSLTMNIEIIKLQIVQTQAQITLWQTKILSGAYKFRQLSHGTYTNNVPFTDEEKLKDSIRILEVQVDRLYTLTEALIEQQ